MGDVEADMMETVLHILGKSGVFQAEVQALDYLLGFTASSEGLETIYKNASSIFTTLADKSYTDDSTIVEKIGSILINVSAEDRGAELLLDTKINCSVIRNYRNILQSNGSIVNVLLEHILHHSLVFLEYACITLANLTRKMENITKVFNSFDNPSVTLNALVTRSLKTNERVDHLANVLSNFSQLQDVREIFLNNSDEILEKILSLIDFKDSVVRRKGAVGVIRNLCLSVENHKRLLNPKLDLLPKLLLPLAGPEEFDDEDNEKLPLDLQYLPEDKTREPDTELRKMLLEILMQLCATKSGRGIMRENNVYAILREYHKWEREPQCVEAVENVVNFLIRTEEEIGVDNVKDVDVPPGTFL